MRPLEVFAQGIRAETAARRAAAGNPPFLVGPAASAYDGGMRCFLVPAAALLFLVPAAADARPAYERSRRRELAQRRDLGRPQENSRLAAGLDPGARFGANRSFRRDRQGRHIARSRRRARRSAARRRAIIAAGCSSSARAGEDLLDLCRLSGLRLPDRTGRGGHSMSFIKTDRLAAAGRPAVPRHRPANGLPRHPPARRRARRASLRP